MSRLFSKDSSVVYCVVVTNGLPSLMNIPFRSLSACFEIRLLSKQDSHFAA